MKKIILVIMLLLVSVSICKAQQIIEIPNRATDSTRDYKRLYWRDSVEMPYFAKYARLTHLPPIINNAPLEIIKAYRFIDSLMIHTQEYLYKIIPKYTAKSDTVKKLLQNFYLVHDYSPGTYQSYSFETASRSKRTGIFDSERNCQSDSVRRRYGSDKYFVLPSLLRKVRKADPYDPESRSYFAIMIADYITKVRVLGVTKVKRRQDTITECPYFVTAEVLDKVKGQQLPLFPTDSLGCQIIQFRYDGSLYSSNWIENVKDIYKNDPLLKVGEDEFGLKVGQEIIAFMRFNTFKCDYDYDYYPLELDYACSNSALPVVNGVVSDVNKIWLPSTNYSYSEWKARFTELVNRIKNGTY